MLTVKSNTHEFLIDLLIHLISLPRVTVCPLLSSRGDTEESEQDGCHAFDLIKRLLISLHT